MNDSNDIDDGVRDNTGIVVSLRQMPDGKTRLIFDAVRQQTMLDASGWSHQSLFTWKDLDTSRLENGELSRDELAQITENLISRLIALGKGGIPPKGYDAT